MDKRDEFLAEAIAILRQLEAILTDTESFVRTNAVYGATWDLWEERAQPLVEAWELSEAREERWAEERRQLPKGLRNSISRDVLSGLLAGTPIELDDEA